MLEDKTNTYQVVSTDSGSTEG